MMNLSRSLSTHKENAAFFETIYITERTDVKKVRRQVERSIDFSLRLNIMIEINETN